jgi:hypothetical protein
LWLHDPSDSIQELPVAVSEQFGQQEPLMAAASLESTEGIPEKNQAKAEFPVETPVETFTYSLAVAPVTGDRGH